MATGLIAQQGKKFSDGRGGFIFLPLGDLSFADEVVDFKRGEPDAITESCDSTLALGLPDFAGVATNFTSLGCGGSLTLRFTDNALVNIDGPDLFVFEVGKFIETMQVYVSKEGKQWTNVGIISGGVSSVDIGDSVKQFEVFNYIKLVDLKSDCKGSWPGADIDAVAAIGSGKQISIDNTIMYPVNEHQLLAQAKKELDKIVAEIKLNPVSKIVIEGHTDSIGNELYNQQLSEKRAESVKKYLQQQLLPLKVSITPRGYGSSSPIANNDTKQGQNKNRRVAIILVP
jgi:outer membrane protein OmpA-like peptidoglycan-associated protein